MDIKKILICVLMVLFFFSTVVAETASSTDSNHSNQEKEKEKKEKKEKKEEKAGKVNEKTPFIKSLVQDQGRIWSSPFRMKGKDFLVWGGVALVTGVLIANDEVIYREFKEYQSKHKWVDDISPQVTKLGLGEWNLGIAGAFYLGGVILKDKKAKETARLTLMTFIHTGLVIQVGKHLSGRQEPGWNDNSGIDHWAGPSGFFERYKSGQMRRFDAFPSGHTISIFGTATVIAEMYKDTVWVPVLSYTVATLSGLSRVTEDTHWFSDVFVGAVLGYAIGKFVVKRRNRLGHQLKIYPIATTHQLGVGVNYTF